jgi:hypothetical protein
MYFEYEQIKKAIAKASARVCSKKDSFITPEITSVSFGDNVGAMIDGNFTMICLTRNGRQYMGVSKRNPEDPDYPEAGLAIACRRLVENSIPLLASSSEAHSVEIERSVHVPREF